MKTGIEQISEERLKQIEIEEQECKRDLLLIEMGLK